MSEQLSVVKLGGSLLDLPGVGSKLRAWLDKLARRHVLVVGGGATVDVIREFARIHGWDEESAHWFAIEAMVLNAHIMNVLLPRSNMVQVDNIDAVSGTHRTPILDVGYFRATDEWKSDHLPHTWDVTSDSIAARVALEFKAKHLYLLKSCPAGDYKTWEEFAAAGIVDKWFPHEAAALSSTEIILVNFRDLP